jgi:hypothetical protein
MLLLTVNSDGLSKLASESHSLELHYPTPKGIMKLTSILKVGGDVVLMQGAGPNKSDALYAVEPEYTLLAIERLRKVFDIKTCAMSPCKVVRCDELPDATYSVILEQVVDGKNRFLHYFANNHYNPAAKWPESEEPTIIILDVEDDLSRVDE